MNNTFFNTIGSLMRRMQERVAEWRPMEGISEEQNRQYRHEYVQELADSLFAPEDRETYSTLYNAILDYLVAFEETVSAAER